MRIINHITGPNRNWTESFNENDVRTLVQIGLIKNTLTLIQPGAQTMIRYFESHASSTNFSVQGDYEDIAKAKAENRLLIEPYKG